jgi:recombination endonuclease VII
MVTEKTCPKCGELKQAAQFYQIKARADGLSSYCRTCQLRDVKSRYSPHPRWRAPEGMKWCPKCETTKPLEAFGSNKAMYDGKQNYCKPCAVAVVTASRTKNPTAHRRSSKAWREANPEHHKDINARWRYGVAHGTYARMFEEQGGKCAICETTDTAPTGRFHIDHCHDTGKVRGLLCQKCNLGIGHLKHDPEIIRSAISYLAERGADEGGD